MLHRLNAPIALAGLITAVVLSTISDSPARLFAADQFIKDTFDTRSEDTTAQPDADDRAADADDNNQPAAQPPITRVPTPAKNRFAKPDPALELGDRRTYRFKWAILIDAPDAPCKGVVAMGPIPMNWPEQQVRLLSQELSPGSRVSEQVMNGQAAVLKFQVSNIPKGGSAYVIRMYEITRSSMKFTMPGEELEKPRGAPPEMREQLAGIPPGVDIDNPKMIELTESLRRGKEGEGAWETVKSFWAWTRDNVKFVNGDFRGAMHAIDQRCGDCEEMSALFVGMCRLSGIPARTVWVDSHDYPEFYLLDKAGKGHWIPAQVLGPPWFGEMAEYRPIFQKGDRFYDPLAKTHVRYVPQTVRGANATVAPKVQFVHQIISDTDINAPSYANSN
jgi:hypothetical protein